MNRIKEADNLVKNYIEEVTNKSSGYQDYQECRLYFLSRLLTTLFEINKNLAVIADKMEEDET